jgi:cytochrome c biogenesis protein CcmG, thiol:disulfide interchange protein DsbE
VDVLVFIQGDMTTKSKLSLLAIILLIFFGTFYFSLQTKLKNDDLVMINKMLPAIKLQSLQDDSYVELPPQNKKNFYLINIWASWCVPCRQEHQLLMRLKKENNLAIYGINYKDNKSNAQKFLEELGNPYFFSGSDMDGSKAIEIGAYGVPETYLIDREGKIILKFIGPISNTNYEQIIQNIK